MAACLVPGLLSARARAEQSPIQAWAEWAASRGQWKGPTVPYPDPVERPQPEPLLLDSGLRPLSVHAPAGVPFETARAVLAALEHAYDLLLETGWPEPFADGGRGQSAGFDLYLQPGSEQAAAAFTDAPVSWSGMDGATSFAVLDPDLVDPGQLEACVVDAYVQAVMLGQDPAEAVSWRRATGAYAAWLATGFFGCGDDVAEQQQQSWRGWITDAPESGAGGALFLAMLSEREDGGTGTFVRELWQFARQQSGSVPGSRLRASPDLWEALDRALQNAGESLDEIVQEMAVARYFAGPEHRRQAAGYLALRTLASNAAVPVPGAIPSGGLPARLPVSEQPLEAHGSGYALIDTSGALSPFTLKVWLRGETGVRWSLAAVRLSSDGREMGRTVAPPRNSPGNYLAVELEPGIDRVLLVVTNLSDGMVDADRDTRNARAFQLIVDAAGYASGKQPRAAKGAARLRLTAD
jgi:hypothetical protein